jgi:predicted nuclease of predicted toxin-antitoxin system
LRLLLDHNLSRRLKRPLAVVYPGTAHVCDFGMERADDSAVWAFAKEHGFAIVSKDSDFHQRSLVFGHPPKVIWLQFGNCSTSDVEDVLRASHPSIGAFLGDATASLLTLRRRGG